MSKSTAAQALASLSYKFQAKIREVGQLKKQITEGNSANLEVHRLRLRNDNLSNALIKVERQLNLSEFGLAQTKAAYYRVQAHTRDVDVAVKALKGDVSNWKSLAAVLFVVGVAVGTLGALGYVTKVAGIY